jgi:hypothetical protein
MVWIGGRKGERERERDGSPRAVKNQNLLSTTRVLWNARVARFRPPAKERVSSRLFRSFLLPKGKFFFGRILFISVRFFEFYFILFYFSSSNFVFLSQKLDISSFEKFLILIEMDENLFLSFRWSYYLYLCPLWTYWKARGGRGG